MKPSNRITFILAAAVVPAIVLLSFPPSIIDGNAHEIAFNRRALYVVWGLFLLASAVFAAVSLWRPRFLIVLTAWAVSLVVWNGLFSHVWLNSPKQMAIAVAAEFALFAIMFAVLSRIPLATLARIAAIFTIATVVTSAPAHYRLLTTLPGKHDQVANAHRADLPPIESSVSDKVQGNVYHIVMDMFATQYMTHRINSGNPPELDGFTFYPKATSNYGRTNFSMRSVFTGDFHPNPLTKWESAFSKGIVAQMRDNGVPMYFFPFYRSYCDPAVIICHGTTDRYFYDRKNMGIAFVSDIAFQSALPLSVRDYALDSLRNPQRPTDTWNYGFSVTGWLAGMLEDGEGVPKWRRTIQAVTMDTLDDFLATEPTLPATGRYVYLHMMVPHPPFSFDPDCVYVNPAKHSQKPVNEAAREQFDCAVKAMETIVQKLRDLGRFDKSLVIFHADHGYDNSALLSEWDPNFAFDEAAPAFLRNTDDLSAAPSHYIEGLASTLLMVHRPGQTSSEASNAQAQLLDIAPTVLDYFDLPNADFLGSSLIGAAGPKKRETVYYEGKNGLLPEEPRLARYVRVDGTWQFSGWSDVAETELSSHP